MHWGPRWTKVLGKGDLLLGLSWATHCFLPCTPGPQAFGLTLDWYTIISPGSRACRSGLDPHTQSPWASSLPWDSPTSIIMGANFSFYTSVCTSILLVLFLWRLLADPSWYVRITRALCLMKEKNQILNSSLFDYSIFNTFLDDKILEVANRWVVIRSWPGRKGWMLGCEHKETGGGRLLWW